MRAAFLAGWLALAGCDDELLVAERDAAAVRDLSSAPDDQAVFADAAAPPDQAVPDLAIVDQAVLVEVDQAVSVPQDFAEPPDLAQPDLFARALRFAAVGDTGRATVDQYRVAAAMAAVCAARGCDFVQLLGDNIYESGVTSTTDSQWQSKFEQPYASIPTLFYAVLGNHDYGNFGAGDDFARGQFEVDYSSVSAKWRMPAAHWRRSDGPVEFFGLDTNLMMFDMAAAQKTTMQGWLAASTAKWKIALGHHPYLSNGPHGNAGVYDGVVGRGANLKQFFDDVVCGHVDVYLCGHDHSRQWIVATCAGSELIVSGAGSSTTALTTNNATWYQASELGFLYVVVTETQFRAEFIGVDGATAFTRTLMK